MNILPPSIQKLIDEFSKLPGIGPRSAQRLVFHLLKKKKEEVEGFGEAVLDFRKNLSYCKECQIISETEICPICDDEMRERTTLCVVADPLDVVALEKTCIYKGLYHVLHGIIMPLDGVSPDDLKIKELIERVEKENFSEIILATNPTMEGEATAMFLQRKLESFDLKITRIARGIPVGGDLEYADEVTLIRSMEGRGEY